MNPSEDGELLGQSDPMASLYSGGGLESRSFADLKSLDLDDDEEKRLML